MADLVDYTRKALNWEHVSGDRPWPTLQIQGNPSRNVHVVCDSEAEADEILAILNGEVQ